jgi:hypothetical protein
MTHPARQAAMDAHKLRHAVRQLADDQHTEHVGLHLAADVLDQIVEALDVNWLQLRPTIEP